MWYVQKIVIDKRTGKDYKYFLGKGGVWFANPKDAMPCGTRKGAYEFKHMYGFTGLKGYTVVSDSNPLFKLEYPC